MRNPSYIVVQNWLSICSVCIVAFARVSAQETNRTPDISNLSNSLSDSNSYSGLTIQLGLVTLNPFTIQNRGSNGTNDFQISSDKTSARFMVQVNYAERWAWNNPPYDEVNWCVRDWSTLWKNSDFQARGAYTFGPEATNGSTIIGSGNLTLELMIGEHLLHWSDPSKSKAGSINLEGSVSITTDRSFLEVHPTTFIGIAYVASYAPPWDQKNRAFFLARIGGASVDVPQLSNPDTLQVQSKHSEPVFDESWRLGLEMEVYYPLGRGQFVSAGGRVYSGHDFIGSQGPTPWSLWVGYSISLDKVWNSVSSIFPVGK